MIKRREESTLPHRGQITLLGFALSLVSSLQDPARVLQVQPRKKYFIFTDNGNFGMLNQVYTEYDLLYILDACLASKVHNNHGILFQMER